MNTNSFFISPRIAKVEISVQKPPQNIHKERKKRSDPDATQSCLKPCNFLFYVLLWHGIVETDDC